MDFTCDKLGNYTITGKLETGNMAISSSGKTLQPQDHFLHETARFEGYTFVFNTNVFAKIDPATKR